MTPPTREDLIRLYSVEGLTEPEIARLYGTYQVRIGRLRAKYGIPTRLKSDRLELPPLTERQKSVLVGSMLGDGDLRRVSRQTARYSEYHSASQKAYLDWKTLEWGPYTASVRPKNKGLHEGFRLTTVSCRELHSYWKLFYPTSKGLKTFVNLPLDWVDSLALAIWFMDDGSKLGTRYARFAVGHDPADHAVQKAILDKFGLTYALYDYPYDTTIHIGSKSMARFRELLLPHLHPSMRYKLL